MKILYFHQHFSTPKGSLGTRSYEMARRLVEKGHEVTIVCGAYPGADIGIPGDFSKGVKRGTIDGIQVIALEIPYSNHDSFLKRI